MDSIKTILSLSDVADVTGEDIREALDSGWKDFEDCVQNRAAAGHTGEIFKTYGAKRIKCMQDTCFSEWVSCFFWCF